MYSRSDQNTSTVLNMIIIIIIIVIMIRITTTIIVFSLMESLPGLCLWPRIVRGFDISPH